MENTKSKSIISSLPLLKGSPNARYFTSVLAPVCTIPALLLLSGLVVLASYDSDALKQTEAIWPFILVREAFGETETSVQTEVTFDSSPRAMSLYIDGVIYAPSQQPVKFSWNQGSQHVVELAENIWYEGYNKRHTFLKWNDFDENAQRTITVSDSIKTTNFIATFKTEYLLTALSEYGNVNGAGWYALGDLATVSVSDVIFEIEEGKKRAVFKGWSGRGLLPNSPSNMIEMTGPDVILADWQEQYHLDLLSEYDLVTGSGWYDRGSVVRIAAQKDFEVKKDEITVEFLDWTVVDPVSEGNLLITDKTAPQTTVLIDKPIAIQANWNKMYYVAIIDNSNTGSQAESNTGDLVELGESSKDGTSGEQYYKNGEIATISVPATIETIPGEERLSFAGWKDVGSGRDMPYGPSFKIKIEEPRTFQAVWKKQYYVNVESMYGTPTGSGWYDEGSDVFIGLEYTKEGLGLGRYAAFRGWISDESPGVPAESESQFTIRDLQGPAKVRAQWDIDDSIRYFIIGGAVSAVLGFGVYIAFLRRKSSVYERSLHDSKSAILNRSMRKDNLSGGRLEE